MRAAGRGQANGATLRADKIAGAYENILTSRESHFGAPTCSACFHPAGGTIWSERDIDARWRDGAMAMHTVAGAALAPLPQPELHAVSGACPSLKLRSPVWLRFIDRYHACSIDRD